MTFSSVLSENNWLEAAPRVEVWPETLSRKETKWREATEVMGANKDLPVLPEVSVSLNSCLSGKSLSCFLYMYVSDVTKLAILTFILSGVLEKLHPG